MFILNLLFRPHTICTSDKLPNYLKKAVPVIVFHLSLIHLFPQGHGFMQIDQEKAVELAMENHLELINQELELSKTIYEKKSLPDLGASALNYRYGQLYSPERGSYFEIIQHIGSLFHWKAENEYNALKKEIAENEFNIIKAGIEREVKLAYNQWIYTHHYLNLLEQLKRKYDDVLRLTELHYNEGAFDLLQKTRFETEYARIRSNYLEAQDEILLAENELKKLLYIDADFVPETEELIIYEVSKDTSADVNYEIDYLENQVKLSQVGINLEKSKLFPELQAGYFYQKLAGMDGFQGISVGLTIPLWYFPKKTSIEKARLSESIAITQLRQREHEGNKEKEALIIEMNKFFKQIQYYKEHALKKAELLIHTSQVRFEKEDIDYFEYIGHVSLALDIQLKYLDAINNYNKKAILLEYYVK